jgi:hypothetical protein
MKLCARLDKLVRRKIKRQHSSYNEVAGDEVFGKQRSDENGREVMGMAENR